MACRGVLTGLFHSRDSHRGSLTLRDSEEVTGISVEASSVWGGWATVWQWQWAGGRASSGLGMELARDPGLDA